LGANHPVAAKERLAWHLQPGSDGVQIHEVETPTEPDLPIQMANRLAVTLQPMQIRTFIVDVTVARSTAHGLPCTSVYLTLLSLLLVSIFNIKQ
jgi:hypothetical protein